LAVGVLVMTDAVTTPDVERVLIERLRRGDRSAFNPLFERYRERLFWVAFHMLRNEQDALDAVQETFVRVLRALDRFDTSRRFYTWACQILINYCVDRLRRQSTTRENVSLEDVAAPDAGSGYDPEEMVARQEERLRVFDVLRKLPPAYRTVIILRELEGFSCKEIAEMTGATHATVRWRLYRARTMFREIWEKEYGGDRDGV